MRRTAPFLLALLAAGGLALADGGYDPHTWNAAVVALAWTGAAGLLLRRVELSRLERAALTAFALLAVWAALSVVWSVSVPLAVVDTQRLLVPAVALCAFLAVGPTRGTLAGVVVAATAASVWNLVTRVGAGKDVGADAQPFGYANALAILAGIGLLLALGLARERRAWLVPCVPLAAVLLLTDSRAGLIAVAAGAVAAAVLPYRRLFPLSLAAGAAVLVATAAVLTNERPEYWRTSLDAAAERPLLGSGAGTWVRAWLAERDVPLQARDAHSLYLETLAELGPVGLGLVLVALALPLVAAVRARERPLVPAATAAYVAFVLHAGVDWDFESAAVVVAGLACGAYLLAAAPAARTAVGRAPLAALSGAALLAVLLLPGNAFEALALDALRHGDAATSADRARTATRLAPWSGEAWRLRGEAVRSHGDLEAAARMFREGIERDEGDVNLWLSLSRVVEGEERRRALERARRLNPLGVAR